MLNRGATQASLPHGFLKIFYLNLISTTYTLLLFSDVNLVIHQFHAAPIISLFQVPSLMPSTQLPPAHLSPPSNPQFVFYS